jgi:hypothetical protein
MTTESPVAIIGQSAVAIVLIALAAGLAYVDPSVRSQLEGALVGGIGVVIGYFFSQRSSAAGVHAATNGMSTMAGLIATATPGPTGSPGPPGPAGPPAPPAP